MPRATYMMILLIALIACSTTSVAQQLTASVKPTPAAASTQTQSQPLFMEVNQHLPQWLGLNTEAIS